MKPILALTDFSAPSENALMYAAHLADVLKTKLVILNVYQIPVSINEMPGLIVYSDDLRENADNNLERVRGMVEKKFPGVNVTTESRMGDVVEEMKEFVEKEHPLMVVVGRHEPGELEKVFFGSVSLSVVRHTSTPVVVVPQNAALKVPAKMALAIDDHAEMIPEEKIVSITGQLQAERSLVHVQKNRSGSPEFEAALSAMNAKCTVIHDHEFMHGLKTYIRQNAIDMLVVFPHRHSLLERWFIRSHTAEILQDIQIPVMCISVD